MKKKAKGNQCQRDKFQSDDQFIENDEKCFLEKNKTMKDTNKDSMGEVRSKKMTTRISVFVLHF